MSGCCSGSWCCFFVLGLLGVCWEHELIEIKLWLSQHPNVVIALIVALTVALIAAMAFHYDLSWIPDILRGLVEWR